MFKHFFIPLLLFLHGGYMTAQDIIHTKDAKTIEAKVLEVGEKEVAYHMYNNLDGPVFKMSTERLYKIVFENGTQHHFVGETRSHNLPADAPLKDLVADGNTLYIVLDDPTGCIDEKDEYIRGYIAEYTKWTVVEAPQVADFILHIQVHPVSRFSRAYSATPSVCRPDGTVVWKGRVRVRKDAPNVYNGFRAVRGLSRDIVKNSLMEELQDNVKDTM